MSASAPTWLLVAVPALCVALMLLVVVCAVVLAGRADDRLGELSRYGAGGSPPSSVRADGMKEWDAEAELGGLKWWDWER